MTFNFEFYAGPMDGAILAFQDFAPADCFFRQTEPLPAKFVDGNFVPDYPPKIIKLHYRRRISTPPVNVYDWVGYVDG